MYLKAYQNKDVISGYSDPGGGGGRAIENGGGLLLEEVVRTPRPTSRMRGGGGTRGRGTASLRVATHCKTFQGSPLSFL